MRFMGMTVMDSPYRRDAAGGGPLSQLSLAEVVRGDVVDEVTGTPPTTSSSSASSSSTSLDGPALVEDSLRRRWGSRCAPPAPPRQTGDSTPVTRTVLRARAGPRSRWSAQLGELTTRSRLGAKAVRTSQVGHW